MLGPKPFATGTMQQDGKVGRHARVAELFVHQVLQYVFDVASVKADPQGALNRVSHRRDVHNRTRRLALVRQGIEHGDSFQAIAA
jgi:hypothetical protein